MSHSENESRYDCLCAGIIVADHLCAPVDHVPVPGELVLTGRMDLSVGGCASNVAVDLAKLGRNVAVVGRVGDDVFGRFIKQSLDSTGIGTEHVSESKTSDTSGTLVINCKGEDRRFIHSTGANSEFTGAEITDEILNTAGVLYLGGYCLMDGLDPERTAEIFRQARAAGVTTLLDVVIPKPADYWPRLSPVLPFTDVFLPNDDEARLITGKNDPIQQAEEFRAAGVKTVVITCGAAGSILSDGHSTYRTGIFPVDFVDGTGSGDAFVAGFIHGLLEGSAAGECLRFGSALGASCVRQMGATTGVFTRDELEAFLVAHALPIEEL